MAAITPIVMPKWGLAMQEGLVAVWHVAEGAAITKGQEIADIESSKIANAFESPVSGTLRRRVAAEGDTLPVGALLAVAADGAASEADIDAFIADFQANFTVEDAGVGEAGPEPEFIDAGGRRLRYLKVGDGAGTPILLVHGFGGDLLGWLFNQPALAERRTTYALDLPGHGGSVKEVGEGDIPAFAAAVLAFMDAAGLERAHYVGHSMGGAIGLELALAHPARLASLTLLCPAGLGAEVDSQFLQDFIATSRPRKLKTVLEKLVADPAAITNEMVEEVLKFKRLDGVDAALRTVAAACFPDNRQNFQYRDRVTALQMPAQAIWGRADQVLPARQGDGLPTPFKVTVLDGAGHLPHMEKAGETNALILGLVERS